MPAFPTYHIPGSAGTHTLSIDTGAQSDSPQSGGSLNTVGDVIWSWFFLDDRGPGAGSGVTSDTTVSYTSSDLSLSVTSATIPTYRGSLTSIPSSPPTETAITGTLSVTLAANQVGHTRTLTFTFLPVTYRQPSGFGDGREQAEGPTGQITLIIDAYVPPPPDPYHDGSAGLPAIAVSSVVPPLVVFLDNPAASAGVSIVSFVRALTPPSARSAGDQRDMAQDLSTGRITCVRSVAGVLQAEAYEGWQNLTGAPARALSPITETDGVTPISGQYPSLWIISEEGRHSLCYQDASGNIVRRDSDDNLLTLL